MTVVLYGRLSQPTVR